MKFVKNIALGLLLTLIVTLPAVAAQEEKTIYYFYGTGCPHCAMVDYAFSKNGFWENYPIQKLEIYNNPQNAELYNQIMEDLGIPPLQRGVPAVVLGDKLLVGGDDIIDNFETEANTYLGRGAEKNAEGDKTSKKVDLTLPAVLAAAAVDAINPCAFAVLIILMSTVMIAEKDKKALYSGLAFAGAVFTSYFLMGLGIYKAIGVSGIGGNLLFKGLGVLAILLGLFNLKDYFWYGKGFLMEVPVSWRPAMKRILYSVTTPLGAAGAGFVVSLFLLPCTSGPYVVILGMLAKKALKARAIIYLVIYNLIFVTPMVGITFAVYKGLDPHKAEEVRQKRLRTMHLIAGVILIGMGLALVTGLF